MEYPTDGQLPIYTYLQITFTRGWLTFTATLLPILNGEFLVVRTKNYQLVCNLERDSPLFHNILLDFEE